MGFEQEDTDAAKNLRISEWFKEMSDAVNVK